MASVSDRSWSNILSTFRGRYPELFRAWFQQLEPAEIQFGRISVPVADAAQHQYLVSQCQGPFNAAAQEVTGRLVSVAFIAPPPQPPREIPLSFEAEDHLILNGDYSFDNFVTGPCNQLAHAACMAVADSPGRVYNPLFIHGDVGLGKTHLLQAVCHKILTVEPGARILYISCETFTNHFVEAIERGAIHQFRYRYRHVDALVIDDIQFLGAAERSRDEFFHTFNTLFQSQKQIILSADESPTGIPKLEDRLVSRFNWGLVARIETPCLETRMAIVRKKAKLRCIEIPENVIHYIATTAESNTRELEGGLTRVLAMSQQFGGIIDLDIARKALGHEPAAPVREVTIPEILKVVMERYNVRLADLQGKRRNRSLAFPRQICMYLARELTQLSLEEIGGYFGGRDHSTVLHSVRAIHEARGKDGGLDATLKQLTGTLKG